MATSTRAKVTIGEVSTRLAQEGEPASTIDLKISTELVHLLSDQLYQSPLKAVEELVINSYDAEAKVCRLSVPNASEIVPAARPSIAVFDDGSGITDAGMTDLWHVGRSNKRSEEVLKRSKRKLIGKFGIGKLATYTVARELTYISKTGRGVTSATLNFEELTADASGSGEPVTIPLRHVRNWSEFSKDPAIQRLIDTLKVTRAEIANSSWTFVVLERSRRRRN